MLAPGSLAPDFSLPNENGEELSLSSMLKDGPLILYFYPADFTPGCTKEACSLRDINDDVKSVGLQILGVSPQDGKSHTNFKQKHNLPFPLLSDPDKIAIKLFEADGPFGIGVRRITYLISEEQKIEAAVQADILINRHTQFIEKAIQLREATK